MLSRLRTKLWPFPPVLRGHAALGEVYFRQGKLYEAEQEFVAFVREGSGNARVYLGMARVSKANSYYEQAKRMIDEAYDLDPDDPDIRRERFEFTVSAEARKAQRDAAEAQKQSEPKDHQEGFPPR